MFIGNIVDFELPEQLENFDESLYIDETEGFMDYKLLADIRRGKLDRELDALIHCQENSEYRNKSVIKAAKLRKNWENSVEGRFGRPKSICS